VREIGGDRQTDRQTDMGKGVIYETRIYDKLSKSTQRGKIIGFIIIALREMGGLVGSTPARQFSRF
jgi:hypothetical protein